MRVINSYTPYICNLKSVTLWPICLISFQEIDVCTLLSFQLKKIHSGPIFRHFGWSLKNAIRHAIRPTAIPHTLKTSPSKEGISGYPNDLKNKKLTQIAK